MTRVFDPVKAGAAALALGLAALPAASEGLSVRAELGFAGYWAPPASLDAALGFSSRQGGSGSARLMWDENLGNLRAELHVLLGAAKGTEVLYAGAIAPFLPPAPPATLLPLSFAAVNGDTAYGARIDRLSLTWSNENLVFKVGRQAITWGEGLVFHPGDIVAPFAPNAADTSYKPGVDMAYGQILFENGADIQAVWVPRPLVAGGAISPAASTLALRGAFQIGEVDTAVMLARDRGDWVGSVGLAGPLGDASWKAEYVGWKLAGGAYRPSWLVNLSNFATLGDVSISYFGEYFRNGFGVAPGTAATALPPGLLKRLGTGQVFLAGRDYLALGAAFQVTPDLSATPSALLSLNDGSAMFSLGVDWAMGDNTNLTLNLARPVGAPGSSFGGIETSPGSGIFASPATSANLKLVRFF